MTRNSFEKKSHKEKKLASAKKDESHGLGKTNKIPTSKPTAVFETPKK